MKGMSVAEAYAAFKNNLSSRSMQKKFIEKARSDEYFGSNRTPETRDVEIS